VTYSCADCGAPTRTTFLDEVAGEMFVCLGCLAARAGGQGNVIGLAETLEDERDDFVAEGGKVS
jgi:hypothetical protein